MENVTINLTTGEIETLKLLITNDFSDLGDDVIWADCWDAASCGNYNSKTISGLVSSLVKKNLVFVDDHGRGEVVAGATELGKHVMYQLFGSKYALLSEKDRDESDPRGAFSYTANVEKYYAEDPEWNNPARNLTITFAK